MKTNALRLLALLGPLLAIHSYGQSEAPLLLQQPTVSKTDVVFVFAGDLWTVPLQGGDAKRLTTGVGVETAPHFSPDGTQIAFSGEYDGNMDVFVMPATGGIPRRLTYHPAPDAVVGWTPDGKNILFQSARYNPNPVPRLYTIPVGGGFPTEVPLPTADEGSYSQDGTKLAYVPITPWQAASWKRYRGGQTRPIWVADLATSRILDKVPRENSNDFNPIWAGDRIYFLSDRNGPVTLFSCEMKTKKMTQLIPNDGFDFKSASAGAGVIVCEQFGALHIYNPSTGKAQRLNVRISADMPEVRPRYVKVARRIASANISPTGARAVFEARGEILTVPVEKGDIRNLTGTAGAMERDPTWSPDGKWIAYFSDESGEYQLHIREQSGMGETRKIRIEDNPSFYYRPLWSPDSKKIAFSDKRLNLWYVDLEKATPVKVDKTVYFNPGFRFEPVWSPDSNWIAYYRQLKSHMNAVFVYSLDGAKGAGRAFGSRL